MKSLQRASIENGIWLCANCADLIDDDVERFPTPLLKQWKADHERAVASQIGEQGPVLRRRVVELSPIDVSESKRIAQAVLGGDVVTAVSFKNAGSPRMIAVLWRKSEATFERRRLVLLEEIGNTFKRAWRGDELYGFVSDRLEVLDLDADGFGELTFEASEKADRMLYVFFTDSLQIVELAEVIERMDAARPVAPEVVLTPSDLAASKRRVVEQHALRRGFLGQPKIDYDDPQFAVQRWHKENGEMDRGRVKIFVFKGMPVSGNSITERLDTSEVLWLSLFKGPLVAYLKATDEHYVVLSPANTYDWINSLAWDGRRLWFGIHCQPGLGWFDPQTKELGRITKNGEVELPHIDALRFDAATSEIVADPALSNVQPIRINVATLLGAQRLE